MSLESHASHNGRLACCGPLDAMQSEGMVTRVFRLAISPTPAIYLPSSEGC